MSQVSGASERLKREPALDAARVFTMVLVVLLHACVAYMVRPIPGLLWPVQEKPAEGSSGAWVCDALFHLCRVLAVPLATVVAGFLAARSLQRHSRREFLRERWRRLGVPLLCSTVLVLIPLYLIWSWGWIKRGWAAPEHILHVRFGPAVQPNLYGLAHLWYLQYLLVYAALLAWAWPMLCRLQATRLGARSLRVLTNPFAQAVAVMVFLTPVLWQRPESVLGFHNGFLPELGQLVKHLLIFMLGIVMGQSGRSLRDFTRGWWLLLLVACAASWFMLDRLHATPKPANDQRWALMGSVALLLSAGVPATLGLLERLTRDMSARARAGVHWLAQASMWVYLVHLVPQGLIVVLLYQQPIPGLVKMLIVLVAGLAVPLLAWTWLRKTRVGRVLGGPETKASSPQPSTLV